MDQMGCTGCNRYIHLKSIFQRNNKDKKKNIRCFPHCCPARGGHKNTGFCGSSVFVTTDIPCDAAICRYESDTIDESRAIALGDVYDRSFIDSAGDYPAQRMVTEDGVIRFVVNPDVNKKGWSYPYDTRIEKNRKHRLSVYFMRHTHGNQTTCVSSVHSAWFTMRSTRMPKRMAELRAIETKHGASPVLWKSHLRRRLPISPSGRAATDKWAVFNPTWHIR
ncbi:hypothetical protein Ae201684P_009740 [Aphanomyces euteiches]|uniref:Uncharacterized protein n=1 Tax=Aphanomyces euteiches TaxID=100861 RepID=A0A6G0WCN3_9STRA|nr:hypothetical protein Ae201684_016435 [Aphanomyces euteiches]KAH9082415.1 hypothetical protein Ae201684P_009740 [Aphanomyces euteiches]